jgi:hypothetical protein
MKVVAASRLALRLGAVALVACLFVDRAKGQPDISLEPTYGDVRLKAGFLPDPHKVKVVAGGKQRTKLGGVRAYVAKAPDVKLHYKAGDFVLTIYVRSEGDTTLLINRPDGTWVADDDGDGFPNPRIRFGNPQSGRYDIYVGTVGPETVAATLFITERRK